MLMALMMFLALDLPGTTPVAPLQDTLSRIGAAVELFGKNFGAITCTEMVEQAKLGKQGKALYQQDTAFDYLIFMGIQGDDMMVDESRVKQKSAGKAKDLPLLITSGFPTLLLIFHPYYQSAFEYEILDEEVLDGRKLLKVHFRHVRGERSTSVLRLNGRDYPLDLQGTAWVEPEAYSIVRITAELESPMEDLGLRTFSSDVHYAPLRFSSASAEQWLPAAATVDVETLRQHWRNVHRFTNYKQFSVDSDSAISR